jgi:triosephosphate isomerase
MPHLRRQLFAGNWKPNLTVKEAQQLALALRVKIEQKGLITSSDCDIIVAPPLLAIPAVAQISRFDHPDRSTKYAL